MTLKADIQRELNRIHGQGGRGLVDIQLPHGRIEADLLGVDAIGVSFQTLAYATDRLAAATIERLKEVSAALTARLTYLLEPIGLVEVDRDRAAVQMRSSPPKKDDDATTYYELMVRKGGDVTLSRYQKRPGQLRQIVAANLTREVFERLADDFVAVVG